MGTLTRDGSVTPEVSIFSPPAPFLRGHDGSLTHAFAPAHFVMQCSISLTFAFERTRGFCPRYDKHWWPLISFQGPGTPPGRPACRCPAGIGREIYKFLRLVFQLSSPTLPREGFTDSQLASAKESIYPLQVAASLYRVFSSHWVDHDRSAWVRVHQVSPGDSGGLVARFMQAYN